MQIKFQEGGLVLHFPIPVDGKKYPDYLQGFIHVRCLLGISSINSMAVEEKARKDHRGNSQDSNHQEEKKTTAKKTKVTTGKKQRR